MQRGPGKDGGIAIFEGTKLTQVMSMPIKKIRTRPAITQFDLDAKGKKQFIKSGPNKSKAKTKIRSAAKHTTVLDTNYIDHIMSEMDIIVIEQQSCRPGNGSKSCAETMTNYGKLLGIAEVREADLHIVSPNKWKTEMYITMTKDEKLALGGDSKLITQTLKAKAVSKAKHLFPEHTDSFVTERGRMLDGVAEAALIGAWFMSK